jgi:hypothetical protein
MSQNSQNTQNQSKSMGSPPTGGFPSASRLASRPDEKQVLKVLQVL